MWTHSSFHLLEFCGCQYVEESGCYGITNDLKELGESPNKDIRKTHFLCTTCQAAVLPDFSKSVEWPWHPCFISCQEHLYEISLSCCCVEQSQVSIESAKVCEIRRLDGVRVLQNLAPKPCTCLSIFSARH
jgi:hypothetical protein